MAPRRSVWLARRSKAITGTAEQGEIAPVHIGERDMVVTRARNIKNEVWVRHVHYLPGDPPDYHEVKWIKVAPSKNKDTDKRITKHVGNKA